MRSILCVLLLGAGCVATGPASGRTESTSGKADGDSSGPAVLLDCNTPVGPDQQVTVLGDGSSLTLRELTTSGAQVDRALDANEWASQVLHLRDDFGAQATLTKDGGTWVTRSTGDGVNEIGDADCWVDQSR